LEIANERMANAIRAISVAKGHDPRSCALVAFGGAGPQHGCAVAELLGIETVLIPADASLLSAVGLGHAVVERFRQAQVLQPLAEFRPELAERMAGLGVDARRAVVAEGASTTEVVVRQQLVHLRLAGQETALAVAWEPGVDLAERFRQQYRRLYGYPPPPRPIEVESIRVVASTAPQQQRIAAPTIAERPASPVGSTELFAGGRWCQAAVHDRQQLAEGEWLDGPALVAESHSVSVVEPGWRLLRDGAGALLVRRRRWRG
jgi:5-oxoprolinase (ATP-hydrolysing)